MKSYLFIVEGSQDISFIGKVLKECFKYKEIKEISKLSKFANSLLPVDFPFKDNSVDIFNVVPTFFQSKEKDIEICCVLGNGQDNLLKSLNDILVESERVDLVDLENITIFADADTYTKDEKIEYLKDSIDGENLSYVSMDSFNGDVIQINKPKISKDVSIFVFPNNEGKGSIEETIIESLKSVGKYKELLNQATDFVEQNGNWSSENSKREKAIIGTLGNIYNAGSSNIVHIGSDKIKWLDKTNLVGGIDELVKFLKGIGIQEIKSSEVEA